jgi:hypothetical protein
MISTFPARRSAPAAPTPSGSPGPTKGWTRLLRASVLGTASLLLAGLGHLAGGGETPDLGLGLLIVAATGMVAVVVTARRCGLPLLLTVLGAEQLVLHALFTGADPAGCASPAASMLHGAAICLPGGDAVRNAASHPLPLLMLAAHLLATVLTAWLLARGEAALWRLADEVVRAATAAVTPWPAAGPRVLAVGSLGTMTARVFRDEVPPRGPPAAWPAVN